MKVKLIAFKFVTNVKLYIKGSLIYVTHPAKCLEAGCPEWLPSLRVKHVLPVARGSYLFGPRTGNAYLL